MPHASGAVVRRVAVAALLIATGNIASRLIGMVREAVIAGLFGRGADVAAFTAASTVPTIVYDLLVNGAISAALVPVFSAYAEEDEAAFWQVAATVINLALGAIALVVGILIWQTPMVVTLLAGGFEPDLREQTIVMTRLLLPAVFFMGLSGLITALLYARQRFLLPAFTTSAFNLGIILGALLLQPWLGPLSLVVGVLLGALFQVVLQLPGLRDATHIPLLTFDLTHPGVRRILALYAPVALGIGFSVVGIVIDRHLASRLTPDAIPTMRYATALIQFPLGLVAAAVSFAILPTLSRQASVGDEAAFRSTLAMGIKVVLLLILPATAGLAALAEPVVALLYQRGAFGSEDTQATARALLLYLPGLPAAALDQMILFAFYARQRTLTPNLVQGAAILIYAATALPLLFLTPLGVAALILANAAQWIGHALILYLLSRRLVDLGKLRIGETVWKCLIASLALFGIAWLLSIALAFAGPPVALIVAGGVATLTYAGICLALRIEALDFLLAALRQRIVQRRSANSHIKSTK